MNYEFKGSAKLGKWVVDENDDGEPCVVIEESSGWSYGKVYLIEEFVQDDWALSDAHLISAAPELLQACIDVHKKFTEILNLDLSKRGNIKIWDELKTVESAIHKALKLQS